MTYRPRTPVPSASRYKDVAIGPTLGAVYETQTTIPIDGTSPQGRASSPFTLALRLPDVFLNEGGPTLSLSRAAASTSASNSYSLGTPAASTSAELQRAANAIVSAASAPRPSGYGLPATNTLSTVFQAADIRRQVEAIRNAPPLTLLVNPAEMSVTYDKVQSYSDRARSGYVFQAWGENQPTISFSGSTAGFVVGAGSIPNVGQQGPTSGYQWAARRDSAAWQNFIALMHFYRSNGYIYDTIGKSEAHLFVGSVVVTYDDWEYVGNIDSLNYSFDENSPLRVQFDMQFVVNRMVDLAPPGAPPAPYRAAGQVTMDPVAQAGREALQSATMYAAGAVSGVALGRATARLERATTPLPEDDG